MTLNQPPTTDEAPPDPTDHDEIWARAVEALTTAARLTQSQGDGAAVPVDFAEFLSTVLAGVAANLGTVEAVTAGRPGSWEADLVQRLISGVVDYGGRDLLAWRTEPLQIPLNVAQLVETDGPLVEPPLPTLDEATQSIVWPEDNPGYDDLSDDERDQVEAAAIAAEEALLLRYTDAYRRYADQFRTVINEEARALTGLTTGPDSPDLRVPVEVQAEADPYTSWGPIQNPDPWDHPDPIVSDLWHRARTRLGLPRP